VLLGKRFRGCHQRTVLAGLDRAQQSIERNDGLAGSTSP